MAQSQVFVCNDLEMKDGDVRIVRQDRVEIGVYRHDGAFYAYADIGHLTDDSLAFCKRLLRETGVATAPGVDFDPVNGRRFIRFSFAVSTAEVTEAIRRLEAWWPKR